MRDAPDIRRAAFAGRFYANSAAQLNRDFNAYIGAAPPEVAASVAAPVRAIVAPHAGYVYSGGTAARTYLVASKSAKYRRILIISPSHYVSFLGLALPEYDACETPLGECRVDTAAVAALKKSACPLLVAGDMAHRREHALEVHLPFVRRFFPDAAVLPLVCGQIGASDATALAGALAPYWNAETLWVISSDFTHYGASFDYVPFRDHVPDRLRQLDMGAVEKILAFDGPAFDAYIRETGATICGAHPIRILLAVIDKAGAKNDGSRAELVEYDTSGAMTGDYEHTVSYVGIAVFGPAAKSAAAV